MADDPYDYELDDDEPPKTKDAQAPSTSNKPAESLFDKDTKLSNTFAVEDDDPVDEEDVVSDHAEDRKSVDGKPVKMSARHRLRLQTSLRERSIARAMTPEQLERFEMYLKSTIPAKVVKEAITAATADKIAVNDNCVTFMRGAAKVLVGELVEEALKIAQRDMSHDPSDALAPRHVLEAHRRLCAQGRVAKVSRISAPKKRFRR